MKKILMLLLCFVMLLSLAACGGNTQNEPADEPDAPVADEPVADEPVDEPVADKSKPDTGTPVEDTSAADDSSDTEDFMEMLRGFIDKPIEELYAVIGQPQSSDYAPSCMGDGEDGMLFYDGFIVYTYREGDTETVYDVE